MPPAEAGVSITVKDVRNNLITLRGDDGTAFKDHAIQVLGEQDGIRLCRHVADAFRSVLPAPQHINPATTPNEAAAIQAEQAAVNNVQAAFPGAQVSTVGQPLPQPGFAPQQQAAPAPQAANNLPQGHRVNPQTGEVEKWIPGGFSKTKTNPDGTPKAYQGFWGKA